MFIQGASEKMTVRVCDVMSRSVHSFTLHHTVREVLIQLTTRDYSGAPLVDEDGRLTGLVTLMDVMLAASIGKAHLKLGELPMSIAPPKAVSTLAKQEPIKEAMMRLLRSRTGLIVVIDETEMPVGVISHKDLARYLLTLIV